MWMSYPPLGRGIETRLPSSYGSLTLYPAKIKKHILKRISAHKN